MTVDDVNDDDSERTIKIVYSESRGEWISLKDAPRACVGGSFCHDG